ncbi:MAG TPA: RNA polymerase sigma factor [Polyangia bacterium]|jgi:RNA polymerase sigma-70 factor (ECF subfamily)|nr:RNA polymerase sigma factor [Polyangia bacterium]
MGSPVGNVLESTALSNCASVPDFDTVYEAQVDFVWRAVRRMGVHAADTDDVVQEVFVIVHRRLGEFEGRAQLKTWVFKILVHVVRHYWRTHQRRPGDRAAEDPAAIHALVADREESPFARLERVEAVRILDRLLAELDDDKREVFVLAEIEQMTAVEIAEIVEANANTVSSRLRAARQEFEKALLRFRAQELRRQP